MSFKFTLEFQRMKIFKVILFKLKPKSSLSLKNIEKCFCG